MKLPRPGRKTAVAIGILLLVALLGAGGVAYATYDYAEKYEGRILPGTVIAGVNVSGMTRAEALEAVKASVRPDLKRTIVVRWNDKKWKVTPKELGAWSNARAAVVSAVAATGDKTFFDKMRMRFLDEDMGFTRSVAIGYPAREARGFIKGIASGVERDAKDAAIDYSTGWVEIVPHRIGKDVRLKETHQDLMAALRNGGDRVELAVKDVQPEVTSDAFDEVLLVRIGENQLYLYEDGEITNSWEVATGQPEYPTPEGVFQITLKRYLPTWVNPDPTGWGASLPAEIGPGPDNPLGVRALNWSAPLIRFHGTENVSSLGYNASHGCVRLANDDIVHLYEMVGTGTPIVSVQVAEPKPLYETSSTTPDPIVVEEDAPDATTKAGSSNKKDN